MSDYARTPGFTLSLENGKSVVIHQNGRELYLAKEAVNSLGSPKGVKVKFV
jgi:hypothetical protein